MNIQKHIATQRTLLAWLRSCKTKEQINTVRNFIVKMGYDKRHQQYGDEVKLVITPAMQYSNDLIFGV